MKNLLMAIMVLFVSAFSFAQDKKMETVVIQTSAECESCKERLEEKLNYTKGVKFSELDVPSKKLTVKYDNTKIKLEDIKLIISKLGYDADEVKADPKEQKKLPACCLPGGMK